MNEPQVSQYVQSPDKDNSTAVVHEMSRGHGIKRRRDPPCVYYGDDERHLRCSILEQLERSREVAKRALEALEATEEMFALLGD